jgi:lysophospholipase L1-like esterase
MRRSTNLRSSIARLTVLALSLPCLSHAFSIETYVALGDSIAFGVTDVIPTSVGDQGYVKLYADFLSILNNGIRPHVINLAIPGETSGSFFNAASGPGLPPHELLASVNLNYHANPSVSQNAMLLATLAAESAAGRSITNVSFAIGVNDVAGFEQMHPDFLMLTTAEQQRLIAEYAAGLSSSYISVLTQLRSALPEAPILLLNYYNPYAILGPDDTLNIAYTIFDRVQSDVIGNLAGPFHASVVDINTPLRGHENELTFISSGGAHPNEQGYAVIAQQMESVTLPEPSAASFLVIGLGALVLSRGKLIKLGVGRQRNESFRRVRSIANSLGRKAADINETA